MEINICDLNSRGIIAEAMAQMIETVTLIGVYDNPDHPDSNDWRIRVYEVGGVRVADTNGDPVWEEDDPEAFSMLLKEYGVEE